MSIKDERYFEIGDSPKRKGNFLLYTEKSPNLKSKRLIFCKCFCSVNFPFCSIWGDAPPQLKINEFSVFCLYM